MVTTSGAHHGRCRHFESGRIRFSQHYYFQVLDLAPSAKNREIIFQTNIHCDFLEGGEWYNIYLRFIRTLWTERCFSTTRGGYEQTTTGLYVGTHVGLSFSLLEKLVKAQNSYPFFFWLETKKKTRSIGDYFFSLSLKRTLS